MIESELGFEIKEVIADSGYGSSENLLFLKSKGIDSYIPLWRPQVGKHEEGFEYDGEADQYLCPEGKNLIKLNNKDDCKMYRALYGVCSKCPRFETCLPEGSKKIRRGKIVRRNINQVLFEEVIEKSQTQIFKDKLRARMWKIGGLFAEGKNRHLLSRAKYRGITKVQIQVYMVATVQNLKRVMAISAHFIDILVRELILGRYQEDLIPQYS